MCLKFIVSCVHAVNQKAREGKRGTGHMIHTAGELTKGTVTVAGKQSTSKLQTLVMSGEKCIFAL